MGNLEQLRAKLMGLWVLDQCDQPVKDQVNEILEFFSSSEIEGIKILSKYL